MKRPAFLFTIVFLSIAVTALSQSGYVFVKKGIKKVKIYKVGDVIQVRLSDGSKWEGYINSLRNDTMFINSRPVPKSAVKEVLLKRPPKSGFPDGKAIALIAAGSVMTSAGLALSDEDHTTEALIAGPVIGFGPLLITHFTKRTVRVVKIKKYKMGNKFYLQVLDTGGPRNNVQAF